MMKSISLVAARHTDRRPSGLLRAARFALAATGLTLAACSGEPQGELTQSVEQELEAGQFVVLNEVEANPPTGADAGWEYLELKGTPGASLVDFQVLVVNGASGTVVMVVNLGTACGGVCAIGSNGILMIKAADVDGGETGHIAPAGTTVVKDAQLNVSTIPNADTAVLLVQGSTVIAEASVLTLGDAGTAALPAGDTLTDGVGWGLGGGYAGVTLAETLGTGSPDGATRLPARLDTSAAAWYGGELAGASAAGLLYSQTNGDGTANLPVGAALTPGAPNVALEVDAGDGGDAVAQDGASDASDAATAEGSAGDASVRDAIADTSTQDVSAADARADSGRDASATTDGPTTDVGAMVDAINDGQGGPIDGATADARREAGTIDSGAAGAGGNAGGAGGSAGGAGGSAGGAGGSAGDAGGGANGGAGAGGGGRAGAAGMAGARVDAGKDAGAVVPPPPAGEDSSGCGCRTVDSSGRGRGGLVLALLALGVFSRRRRSHRA
jgi:MYXO-CTERM domain-containing protein